MSSSVFGGPNGAIPERVVAVTGARGLLGRALLNRLGRDASVVKRVALDLEPPPDSGVRFHRVDLTLPGVEASLAQILEREGVDTLVHLAFLSDFTHRGDWAHELESIGTLHVLDACRQGGVKQVVQWSQGILYGAHPDNPAYLTEVHPLRAVSGPNDTFFADKIDAERQVRQLASERSDMVVSVLRIAPILTFQGHGFLSRMLRSRFVPVLLGHDPLLQLTHVDDAARALHTVVAGRHAGVFNIASDGVLPLRTVLALLGRLAVPVPSSWAQRVSGALWMGQLIDVPPSFLDFLRFPCVLDTDRARRELGFEPRYDVHALLADQLTARAAGRASRADLRPVPRDRAGGVIGGAISDARLGNDRGGRSGWGDRLGVNPIGGRGTVRDAAEGDKETRGASGSDGATQGMGQVGSQPDSR